MSKVSRTEAPLPAAPGVASSQPPTEAAEPSATPTLTESPKPSLSPAPLPTPRAPLESAVLDEYSLVDLNLVSLALNNFDQAALHECVKDAAAASALQMKLRSLVAVKLQRERESYQDRAVEFVKQHNFETCAATCSCEILLRAIENADVSQFQQGSQTMHNRLMVKLRAKLKLIRADSLRECASTQSSFCGSDLQRYLSEGT